jgi:hypothetical protein
MAVLWSTHVEKLDVWRMEMDRCIHVSALWVDLEACMSSREGQKTDPQSEKCITDINVLLPLDLSFSKLF